MTVIDDILLVRLKVDLVDGSETIQQEHALSTHLENKEAFSTEQAAAQTLHLTVQFDRLSAGKEPVFLHHIFVDSVQFQHDDFPRHRRRQEDLARSPARPKRLEKELLARQKLAR